jgi:hypothetical protein
VDFVAEPALGADPEAVADDQHPDHELGIDRGPADLTVEGPQMRSQPRQVHGPDQWRGADGHRDVPLQAELVEQSFLRHPPLAHHPAALRPESE